MAKIVLEVRSIYGEVKYYPACPTAQAFCDLVKQKTLTTRDINIIKRMGYTVECTLAPTIREEAWLNGMVGMEAPHRYERLEGTILCLHCGGTKNQGNHSTEAA